jgi:hypothetical protein
LKFTFSFVRKIPQTKVEIVKVAMRIKLQQGIVLYMSFVFVGTCVKQSPKLQKIKIEHGLIEHRQ